MPSPENSCSTTPDSCSALTALVMFSRPENRMPNPMAILPTDLEFRKIPVMIRRIPIIRATGARVDGWKKRRTDVPEALISSRRMICPVTVVPTFAPMMIPRDWRRDRIPAPTRPEVITMVAVEDWISAVTAIPSRNALKALSVTFSMMLLKVFEEFSFSESPIRRMPYRNIARPPRSDRISKKFIKPPLCPGCRRSGRPGYGDQACFPFYTRPITPHIILPDPEYLCKQPTGE